jgi:hypothetical protein
MHKLILSTVLTCFLSISLFAQETNTTQQKTETQEKTTEQPKPRKRAPIKYLEDATIKDQFDHMFKRSNRYEDKKIIKIKWLNTFHENVTDSLNQVKKQYNDSQSTVSNQGREINSLKADLEQVKKDLENTQSAKDSMSLLGIQMPKGTYNTIMWTLIIGALAVAGVCFMLFKRSNVITVETKTTLEEVREEFEQHRKNALVREQKLARKLQDEVIKNKNLGL